MRTFSLDQLTYHQSSSFYHLLTHSILRTHQTLSVLSSFSLNPSCQSARFRLSARDCGVNQAERFKLLKSKFSVNGEPKVNKGFRRDGTLVP